MGLRGLGCLERGPFLAAHPNWFTTELIFLIEDHEMSGLVHEHFMDDLVAARDQLLKHGCEVIRWRGKGQDR